MKSLALLLAIACSGCFSTWAGMQAGGHSLAWDENKREETVPLPATDERLVLALPLHGDAALSCKSAQHARETVYRASFRYGSGWKKATALAFVTEAAIATAYALAGNRDDPRTYVYGGFFAIDAVGTAALFFVPRKDRFAKTERDVATPLREDCPEGLTIEIAGTTYPVDAAGKLGEAGELALEDWLKAPTGELLASYAGRTTRLMVEPQQALGVLAVPLGTLTALAE
ncbi:MAG TPA: hypothetical protein VFV99_17025 [Kofleriaceae bacterium]|nr:hypothetical protein [Kofleriaceae bacterium]